MTESSQCSACGTELPDNAPADLCPRCLLQSGFADTNTRDVDATLIAATEDAPKDTVTPPVGDAHPDSQPPPAAAPAAGTQVPYFGDYELLEEVARGGMGVVYRARQVRLNRIVALKMILAGQFASEADVQRFQIEAESAAQLDHAGIVPIFEVGEHEGLHFFSMAFVEGQSLSQRMNDGPLPPQEAARLVREAARAIAYAHAEGVIHRDLKPANILVDSDGQPRVTDFGLAKRVRSDSQLTATGQILGTPGYMAPEQAAGRTTEVGAAADVYSLGAVLYATLTGRAPFAADNPLDTLMQVVEREPVSPLQLNPAVPADLATISLKCLRKDRRQRYAAMSEFADDLDRYLSGQPILARPAGLLERAFKWSRRRPAVATLLVVIVLAVVGAFLGGAWHLQRVTDERNRAAAAEADATQERNRAVAVTRQAVNILGRALYQKARARLAGNAPGRRAAALSELQAATALREATGAAPGSETVDAAEPPDWSGTLTRADELVGRQPTLADLRTQAVAALLTPDGEEVRAWDGHVQAVSPDGGYVVVAHLDPVRPQSMWIKVVRADSGDVVREVRGVAARRWFGSMMGLSPKGQQLAVAGLDFRSIRLLDVSRGTPIRELTLPDSGSDPASAADAGSQPSAFRGMAFSPDGRWLLVSRLRDRGTEIFLWDLADDSVTAGRSLNSDQSFPLMVPVYSPDGRYLAWADGGTVVVYELAAATSRRVNVPFESVTALTWLNDMSGWIVNGHTRDDSAPERPSAELVVCEADDGSVRRRILAEAPAAVTGCAVTPDGRYIAIAELGGDITVVHAERGDVFRMDHGALVQQLVWNSSGTALLSAGPGVTRRWEIGADSALTPVPLQGIGAPEDAIRLFALHPQEPRMAVQLGRSRGIRLHEWPSGTFERVLPDTPDPARGSHSLRFTPDGRALVHSGGREVTIWRTERDGAPQAIAADSGWRLTTTLACRDDGTLWLAGIEDGHPTVKDASSGALVWRSGQRALGIVRLSPDGSQVAFIAGLSGGTPRTVSVHRLPDGEETARLPSMHDDLLEASDLHISPQGRWLVEREVDSPLGVFPGSGAGQISTQGGANRSSKLVIHDLSGDRAPWRLTGETSVTEAAFSPDDRWLALTQRDGRIMILDLTSQQRLFHWQAWSATAEPEGATREATWTADGTQLVVADERRPALRFLNLMQLRSELRASGLSW